MKMQMQEHEVVIINDMRSIVFMAKRSRWLSELRDNLCFQMVLGAVQEQRDVAAMLSKLSEQDRLRIMQRSMPDFTFSAARCASLLQNTSVETRNAATASYTAGQTLEMSILERDAALDEFPEVFIGQQLPRMHWAGHHRRQPAAASAVLKKEDQLCKTSCEIA